MSFADELLNGNHTAIDDYINQGGHIDDIDEYGFTALIESAIANNFELAKIIIDRGADVNKADLVGRTALHWTIDNANVEFSRFLLEHGADANSFTTAGQSPLVYPILRQQKIFKQLLLQYGGSLAFAQDFINAKLVGHRYHLQGYVDIINHLGEFIELNYEGFFLEFSVDVILHSLQRYKNNYGARNMRHHFHQLTVIIDALHNARKLLQYQRVNLEQIKFDRVVDQLFEHPLLILPLAYQGHAVSIVIYGNLLAKIDRGERGKKEGTVNIYFINQQSVLNNHFYKQLMYQRLSEQFIHEELINLLQLAPLIQLPISLQSTGNCSWANIEASIPTAYLLLALYQQQTLSKLKLNELIKDALVLYEHWHTWDEDRALNECIQQYQHSYFDARRASKAAVLAGILFQSCQYDNKHDVERANKIMQILEKPEHRYILTSYVQAYCLSKHTRRGNHLLHFLEDAGIDLDALHIQPRPVDRTE